MFCVYNLVTLCTYFCINNQVSSPRSPQIPGGRLWLWFCARNSLYTTLNNSDACCLSTRLFNDSIIYVYLRHLSTRQPSQDAPSDGTDAAAEVKAKTVEHHRAMVTSSRSIILPVAGAPVYKKHDGLEGNKVLHNKNYLSAWIGKSKYTHQHTINFARAR